MNQMLMIVMVQRKLLNQVLMIAMIQNLRKACEQGVDDSYDTITIINTWFTILFSIKHSSTPGSQAYFIS
jgi:hypothetical protein